MFESSPHGPGKETKPLVIHCSDPRFQPHFQDFLGNGLGLTHYALIAVPGGAQCLVSDDSPEFGPAGWQWVEVMEKVAQPERIILIAHSDCRWYLTMGFAQHPSQLCERQASDLVAAQAKLSERFTAPVELYYASLKGDRAYFESVAPTTTTGER